MNESTLLLEHHLKALKLPTFLRDFKSVAAACAQDQSDYHTFLLRLAERELSTGSGEPPRGESGMPPSRWSRRWIASTSFPALDQPSPGAGACGQRRIHGEERKHPVGGQPRDR